ncbi:GFA family protein [Defluviimonas sp. WL0050]|uniref:GFA family protein n=1 Tax=Albidovulum litorale TaxID=2984134 RepID=A0ABT2ZU10_9RHOB|nr:GFA family protein [Defluviimonas sp. WL0050]MCV2874507.1 GFA family protein [Defluviimonas sp. WL0050]
MTETDPTRTGGCRCGAVRFTVSADPLITMACHCKGCQRMTASAFSLSSLHRDADFTVTKGEPVIGGAKNPDVTHYCCPDCMSWLFTRPTGLPDFVNVRATMMDDCTGYVPFIETQTDEMLPWAKTGAKHSFARFPAMEEFPALMAEYAEQGR